MSEQHAKHNTDEKDADYSWMRSVGESEHKATDLGPESLLLLLLRRVCAACTRACTRCSTVRTIAGTAAGHPSTLELDETFNQILILQIAQVERLQQVRVKRVLRAWGGEIFLREDVLTSSTTDIKQVRETAASGEPFQRSEPQKRESRYGKKREEQITHPGR